MSGEAEEEKSRRQAGRSPAYPVMSVEKAVEQARALYKQERDYAAPLLSAMRAWGYSPKSSGGRQTLATLRYYGLIEVTGEGDGRRVKVSDTARRIILDDRPDETEKRQLIRTVALLPSAHKLMFKAYGSGLPGDSSVEYDLIHDHGFNPEAAKELLAEFKETARFIGLYEPSGGVDKTPEIGDKKPADNSPPTIRVGDRIQWVVNDAESFEGGAVVEAIHSSGEWLWVSAELCKSGIPMSQVELVERGAGDTAAPPPRPQMERKIDVTEPAPELGKPKVTIEGDVMTIVASVKMSDLAGLKKKIEGLEIFYNS